MLFRKGILFIFPLALIITLISSICIADKIILKNGKTIITDTSWSEGDEIKYQKYGAIISIKKKNIQEYISDSDTGVEIKFKGYDPYIRISKNKWSQLVGRDVVIGPDIYRYEYDEGNNQNGKLYKNEELIAIYINGNKESNSYLDEFKENIDKQGKRIETLSKNIKNSLSDTSVYSGLAKSYMNSHDFRAALEQYEKILNQLSIPKDEVTRKKYNQYLRKGNELKSRGMKKNANQYYLEAISLYPGIEALENIDSENLNKYSKYISKTLVETHYNRAVCYLSINDNNNAQIEYYALVDLPANEIVKNELISELRSKLKINYRDSDISKQQFVSSNEKVDNIQNRGYFDITEEDMQSFSKTCLCRMNRSWDTFPEVDFKRISYVDWSKIRKGKRTVYDELVLNRDKLDQLIQEDYFSNKRNEYREARKLIYNVIYCLDQGCSPHSKDNSDFYRDYNKTLMISNQYKNDYKKLLIVQRINKKNILENNASNSIANNNLDNLLKSGKEYFDKKDYENGIALISKYINLGGDSYVAFLCRGDCYSQLYYDSEHSKSDFADFAAYDYQTAIKLGEPSGIAHINLGMILWLSDIGKGDAPVNQWKYVIENGMEETPQAFFVLGNYYNWEHQPQRANHYMKEAAKLGHPEAVNRINENQFWGFK